MRASCTFSLMVLAVFLASAQLTAQEPKQDKAAAIKAWLPKLRADDANVRHEAVTALAKLLRDSDAEVREHAVSALASRGSPVAILALGQIGQLPPDAIPDLIRLLKEDRRVSQYHAAYVLADLGPAAKDALPTLRPLLRSKDDEVRHAATRAVGRMGPYARAAVPDLLAVLKEGGNIEQAMRALGFIGPAARAAVPLLMDLADKDQYGFLPLYTLGMIGPTAHDAMPVLAKVVKNPEGEALRRWNAALALGTIGRNTPDVAAALAVAAQDKNRDIRWAAYRALALVRPASKESTQALCKALEDEDSIMASLAAQCLARHQPVSRAALIALVRASRDSEMALLALGQIGPPARPTITGLLAMRENSAGRNRSFVGMLPEVLGQMGEIDDEVAAFLVKQMTEDRSVKAAVALVCNGRETPQARELLMKQLLGDDDSAFWTVKALVPYGPRAKALAPVLRQQLQAYQAKKEPRFRYTRHELALALARTGTPDALAAIPTLGEMLGYWQFGATDNVGGDIDRRCDVLAALGGLGPAGKEAIPIVLASMVDPMVEVTRAGWRALEQIDPLLAKQLSER